MTPPVELDEALPRARPRPQPGGELVGRPLGRAWSVSATLSVAYEVHLTPGLLDPDNDALETHLFAGPSRRRLFVVDQKVFELFGDRLLDYVDRRSLRAEVVCLAADESLKDVELSSRISAVIDDFGIDRRNEPIVAVGGGVLLDVVAYVASLYRRGIPYVKIPTTLLALVDAGVGIKTGVNHDGHKNRLGTYHPPTLALLDPDFLTTLPGRHISNGLAEIAKMGLMCDARLWALLARHAETLVATHVGTTSPQFAGIGQETMTRAVHSMLVELQPNLWEFDLHRLVDFGHTFSPTIEMVALPSLLHGEAVTIDMAISCALSTGRGLLPQPALRSVLGTFTRLGLPLTHPACTTSMLERGLADTLRHRSGRQRLPVPVQPGCATFLEDVDSAELDRALRCIHAFERARDAGR